MMKVQDLRNTFDNLVGALEEALREEHDLLVRNASRERRNKAIATTKFTKRLAREFLASLSTRQLQDLIDYDPHNLDALRKACAA